MYDYAGSWLYRVGMPAKSGVARRHHRRAAGPARHRRVFAGARRVRQQRARRRRVRGALGGVRAAHAAAAAAALGRDRTALHARRARFEAPADAEETQLIAEQGEGVQVFRLQGPLAFSTAEVALRHASDIYAPGHTIVFDCRRVDRADAAAVRLLDGFASTLRTSGGALVVSALRGAEDWRSGCEPDEAWLRFFDIPTTRSSGVRTSSSAERSPNARTSIWSWRDTPCYAR